MKNLLFVLIACIFWSCQSVTPPTTLILSGKITNPAGDELKISGNDLRLSILVNEDGSFSDTLELPTGFYNVRHGEWTSVFLKPGYNLFLTVDTDAFDESITYTGIGSNENNYLAKKVLNDSKIWGDRREFFTLEEADFLNKLTENIAALQQSLDSVKGLSDEFRSLEIKSLNYKKLLSISQYSGYHGYYVQNDSFQVSEDFEKPLATINYDDSVDFAIFDNYRSLVDSKYLNYETLDENPESIKTTLAEIRALKSQNIKNALVKTLSVFFLSPANPEVTTLYDGVMELSNNEEFKKEVTIKYETVKALAPGNPAPVFTYNDKDGKAVSLTDLQGKYVYIDVWATWCGPCLREIPSLKKMEEAYGKKNIQFVSISIDAKKDFDTWQKMIVEKELTGLQLFAEGDWGSQLAKDYSIESIPRFLLIDPQGLIISADAYRPSDPKLATQFDGFGAI